MSIIAQINDVCQPPHHNSGLMWWLSDAASIKNRSDDSRTGCVGLSEDMHNSIDSSQEDRQEEHNAAYLGCELPILIVIQKKAERQR